MPTITLDAMRHQYGRNAQGLADMAAKARAVAPKKYRGYTVAELEEKAELFNRLATGSDDALRAHLAACFDNVRKRAAENRAKAAV